MEPNGSFGFAVSLYHEETDATFDIRGLAARATAKVIEESRSIAVTNGKFADHFGRYDVHLYRGD